MLQSLSGLLAGKRICVLPAMYLLIATVRLTAEYHSYQVDLKLGFI